MGPRLSMSSLARSPASSQSGPMAGSTRVPRRRYRSWRRETSGCHTRNRTGAPSPSARGLTTSCTSSACFRRARTTTTWMPSRNSSRAASGRSRAGWSGSRRLLDAGNLRDDARLLRPAVDGTYEDGEPEWAPTRWRLRSTAATVRPSSRTGRTAARYGRRHGLGRSRLQGGPRARRRRRHDLSHTAGAGSTPVRQWAWEGPWAATTHGGRGRRGWRKRHRGVDPSGVIRVHTLTEETGDDATLALDRLTAVKGPLARVTADAASDTVAIDETARARGATVVVPPARTATGLWPRPAVARAGSNDPVGQDARPVPLEAGVRVPSSGPGGEHVLPRHVHHRRWPSRPESSQAGECGRPRLCDPESDDRPRPTRVISPRPMRILSVGLVRTRHDSCTNACAGKARSRGTRCRDVIFETLFETLWVSNPIRPRSAASRNRVMRGPGVTQGAKRSQGARRPRD